MWATLVSNACGPASLELMRGSLRETPEGPGRGTDRAKQGHVRQVLQEHCLAAGVAERYLPVRVLVAGAGEVLGAAVADGVGQRDADQRRGGQAQVAIQRHGELVGPGKRGVPGP